MDADDRNDGESTTPAPRPARLVLTALIVAIAAAHLLAVTAAALPPNQVSQAARPATGYLGSYFAQNWRLFAPNPISADRTVRFQGAFDVEGEIVTTDWIDWTAVELDLVRRHLVGGRAGYVTNKAYGSLGSRYRDLDQPQRVTADVVDPAETPEWSTLETDLRADSQDAGDDAQVEVFLAYDRALTTLATAVLRGRDAAGKLVAVRWATRSQGVTPWEERGGSDRERTEARPDPEQRINGWRRPLAVDESEARAITEFDRRHR